VKIEAGSDREWVKFSVVMPIDSFELLVMVRTSMEVDGVWFSDREPVAIGRVFELVLAEYVISAKKI